jgi:putative NIF3 family GTP cyclohydrolase 1 type 2
VISGGGGAEVAAIREAGIDTFLTGEGPHWSYTEAEELGLNVLYGGHYLTETSGVRALVDLLVEKYSLDGRFIEHPTGM